MNNRVWCKTFTSRLRLVQHNDISHSVVAGKRTNSLLEEVAPRDTMRRSRLYLPWSLLAGDLKRVNILQKTDSCCYCSILRSHPLAIVSGEIPAIKHSLLGLHHSAGPASSSSSVYLDITPSSLSCRMFGIPSLLRTSYSTPSLHLFLGIPLCLVPPGSHLQHRPSTLVSFHPLNMS
uniref:(California timema) hypothetical protein n=1 Tax=Timema californicum TaxID=61474 RepID=A0A7R9P5T3_TIMCA|nr:unnamed protein product [Timema californicum]